MGQANAAIAEYVFTSFRKLPKIMQVEVVVAYERFEDRSLTPIFTIEENRSRGAHLDTREVNAQAVDIMHWYGWKRAFVVAHAHHIARVDATLLKMGVETVVPTQLPKTWDRHAEQAEVRSALHFGLVTVAAVGIYKFHGWI